MNLKFILNNRNQINNRFCKSKLISAYNWIEWSAINCLEQDVNNFVLWISMVLIQLWYFIEEFNPALVWSFVKNQSDQVRKFVEYFRLERLLLASFLFFKQCLHYFQQVLCELAVVIRISIVDQFNNQLVCKAVVVLHRQWSGPSQNCLNLVKDRNKLSFIDLPHYLVVIDRLAQQILHRQNKTAITSLGNEFANYFVLIQELLAESKLTHFCSESLHRIRKFLLLWINLVWL